MKETSVLLYVIILSCTILSCNPSPNSTPNNTLQVDIDSLDNVLTKISKETAIPGFAAKIIRGDSIIYSKGFGYADLANEYPFTPQTIHTVASISKTFVGVAIMQLVEDGKLNLDDPINNFLPYEITSPHFPEVQITVRHLVTHTSSINDEFDDGEKRPSRLLEKSRYQSDEIPISLAEDIYYYDGIFLELEDYLKAAFTPTGKWYSKSNFSDFKPGEKYEYSNEGSNLAALIVEKISGEPFSEFTQKNILKPLGMSYSFWHYQELDSSISKLYIEKEHNGNKVFEFPRYIDSSYPCGDLKSNTEDLSKYLVEIKNGLNGKGKILNATSYQTLLNPQLASAPTQERDEDALNDEYNVGVFWAVSEPGIRLHKGGSIGVYSILYFNPKNDVGVITYCNLAHPDFGKIVNAIREFEKNLE